MTNQSVYLDFNATTPLDELVKTCIIENINLWGNPSSSYKLGTSSRNKIEEARAFVAQMIMSHANDIIFKSGGTECNNSIIYSVIQYIKYINSSLIPHIITSNIEHDSITKLLQKLESQGSLQVTYLSCKNGYINPNDVVSAIKDNTLLITIILANNETGIIQPLGEIVSLVRYHLKQVRDGSLCKKLLIHTDAAQIIGKVPISIKDLGVDAMTIVGHKFYGPRVGALYYNEQNIMPFTPIFYGGGQEKGLRAGTENTIMLIALGQACKIVADNINAINIRMKKHTLYLIKCLTDTFNNHIYFNNIEMVKNYLLENSPNHNLYLKGEDQIENIFEKSCSKYLLPNTLNISFTSQKLAGHLVLEHCPNLNASTGAACHTSFNTCGSTVLLNSGLSELFAKNAIRLSIGRETTKDDIEKAVKFLQNGVNKILDH